MTKQERQIKMETHRHFSKRMIQTVRTRGNSIVKDLWINIHKTLSPFKIQDLISPVIWIKIPDHKRWQHQKGLHLNEDWWERGNFCQHSLSSFRLVSTIKNINHELKMLLAATRKCPNDKATFSIKIHFLKLTVPNILLSFYLIIRGWDIVIVNSVSS